MYCSGNAEIALPSVGGYPVCLHPFTLTGLKVLQNIASLMLTSTDTIIH